MKARDYFSYDPYLTTTQRRKLRKALPKLATTQNAQDTVTMKLCESLLRKGTWKVWIKSRLGSGYLRQGFAWKTRLGAEQAANKQYPAGNWIS